MRKINFVFWGTPEVASETLEILKQDGFLPSLIITSPDAKSGRGMCLHASPVAIFAEKNNIPCLKPEKFTELLSVFTSEKSGLVVRRKEKLKEVLYDLFIVVAYGKIIPEEILKIPKMGSINIHYSLLPKYRGASPVESAILNGETETGVTIQQMEFKMDTGAIITQEKISIDADEKAPDLRKRLIKIGGKLLVKILPDFVEKKIKPTPQDGSLASVCKKIKKEDGLINLGAELPSEIYRKYCAYWGWPSIYFLKNGKRIKITDAKLENGQFIIKKVIPEGKKEMDWKNHTA